MQRRLHYRVRGYLKTDDVRDGAGRESRASSGGCSSGSSDLTDFVAGTRLYDRPGGALVAVVLRDTDSAASETTRAHWTKVRLPTFSGILRSSPSGQMTASGRLNADDSSTMHGRAPGRRQARRVRE